MGNPRFTPPFTQTQLRTLVILPKIGAIPSLLACPFIIHHVLSSRHRRRTVYHRLVLVMTCHDWCIAMLQFLGTWLNPVGDGWLAAGTEQTCTATGFLRQGCMLSSILYSAFLTLFFLLVVKYGWSERRLVRQVEPLLHAVALSLGWGAAVAGLVLDLYAPYQWGCGVVAYPPGCTQSYKATPENPATCTKGDNAGIYSWAFATAWIWATFLWLIIAMTCIYQSIRQKERKSEQYRFEHQPKLPDSSTFFDAGKQQQPQQQQLQEEHHQHRHDHHQPMQLSSQSLTSATDPARSSRTTFNSSAAMTTLNETDESNETNVTTKSSASNETTVTTTSTATNNNPTTNITTNNIATTESVSRATASRPALINGGNTPPNGTTPSKSRRKSQEFASQALLYCIFFFLTFMAGSINISLVNWGPEQPYMPLMVVQSFFGAMLGFFNFLVYVRPRFLAYKRLHPNESFWSIVCQHALGGVTKIRRQQGRLNLDSNGLYNSKTSLKTQVHSND